MADNNQHDKNNLIDLASQRRKFQNRPAPTGPKKHPSAQQFSKKTGTPAKKGPRWLHYVQLILFLAFLAWVQQKCQGNF